MAKNLLDGERELEEEKAGDHPYFSKEKEYEATFDKAADDLAQKYYGGQEIPWLKLTEFVVWVLIGLTILNMLKRPAVITLTVAILAMYVLNNTHTISRSTFRGFVVLIALSWVYDAVSLLIIEPSLSTEDAEDGGHEYKIRRFTRLTTYILFLWKFIVALVFWKDSLDFSRIIRNKKAMSEEEELNIIMAQYSP